MRHRRERTGLWVEISGDAVRSGRLGLLALLAPGRLGESDQARAN